MTRYALGLDGGGTATRWRLEDADGTLIANGKAAPVSGHLHDAGIRSRTFAALADILQTVRPHGRAATITAGITGLEEGSRAAVEIAAFLAEGAGAGRVQVVDDMWIAYHAAFGPGEGYIVYSGTGSVGYHVTCDGQASRVGGHGWLIDDGGSAAWIALTGLRRVMRGLDADPEATRKSPLFARITAMIGAGDWDSIRAFVYSNDRGRVGALAKPIAEAAGAGDPDAAEILRSAGMELARLADVLVARHGEKPVALMGGTARLSPLISDAVRARVGTVVEHRMRPVEAAAMLARQAL